MVSKVSLIERFGNGDCSPTVNLNPVSKVGGRVGAESWLPFGEEAQHKNARCLPGGLHTNERGAEPGLGEGTVYRTLTEVEDAVPTAIFAPQRVFGYELCFLIEVKQAGSTITKDSSWHSIGG